MAAWWTSYIARRAQQLGLDPKAVLAVAAQEGLSGRPGDNNTSFGPFQLHAGGALPRGRGRAWAESPAGIDYALQRIAGVARGLRGQAAIQNIVSRFERPANPGKEIQGALSAYGGQSGIASNLMSPAGGQQAAGPAVGNPRAALASFLIAANQSSARGQAPDYSQLGQLVQQARQPTASVTSPSSPLSVQGGAGPPTGGPSLSFLSPLAQQFGLQITSTTEGTHAPGSYHYQRRAEDYGGSPQHEAALQRYALSRPRQFTEVFYTGPGAAPYFVKNGRVYPVALLDKSVAANHRDHVHIAR